MKRQYLALLTAISMLAGYNNTYAQFNSAARVNAGGDRALCGTSCFDLKATLSDIRGTDNYIVDSSLDFNAHYPFYIPGSSSVPAENNIFSEAIDLPFTFCFYGKQYDQLAIGSNGIISFDEESFGNSCDAAVKKAIPARAYAHAAIMPAYEALDINLGGSIYYSSEGYAPNRRFIINYNNIPLRKCKVENVTFQVVLYEATNVIELYLKDKPSCMYFHDGVGIAGIQNNHKEGMAIPGKNATRWGSTGMNAAYRFIPMGGAGTQLVQLSSIDGKIISSVQASSLENGQLSASFGNICIEGESAKYVVSTVYSNCKTQNTCTDTINITRNNDCGSGNDKVPVPVAAIKEKPVINESDIVHGEGHIIVPSKELVVNHVSTNNPTTCLGINGSVNLHGLQPNAEYTIEYNRNGVAQKAIKIYSNAAGAVIISRLSAGKYTDIKASKNGSSTNQPGPYVLTDPELPGRPMASNNGPVNPGENLKLSITNEDRVSYTWLGPGFAAVSASPVIMNAQPYNSGTYTVIATKNGCNSEPTTTTVAVTNPGGIPNRTVPIRINNNSKPYIAPVKVTPAIAVKQKPNAIKPAAHVKATTVVAVKQKANVAKPAAHVKTTPVVAVKQKPSIVKPVAHVKATPAVAVKQKPPPIVKPVAAKQQQVKVYASTNAPVCTGSTLKLHATAINASEYSWEGPNNFTSNAQNPALNDVTANAAGIYTVVAKGANNNYAINTVTVRIDGMPVIDVKNHTDPKVCYGYTGSITLSGFKTGRSYNINYSKNTAAQAARTLVADSNGDVIIDKLGQGDYSNIYVVAGKCSSNKAGPVTIGGMKAPERPLASNSGATCQGGNVTLSASDIQGATYTWVGPNKFMSHEQSPALNNVQPAAAGVYSVIASVGGCNSEPATTTVSVKRLNSKIVASSNSPINASGGSLKLKVTTVPGAKYRWTGPNFNSDEQNPVINSVTEANSGDYSVHVSVDGCQQIEAITRVDINEYKGIVMSRHKALLNDTITVNYTDPIRDKAKVRWDFGDAAVVSGRGTGPYVLSWNKTGQHTVSLYLPFNIPDYEDKNRLHKDVYIYAKEQEGTTTDVVPDPHVISPTSNNARHTAEETVKTEVHANVPVVPVTPKPVVHTESIKENPAPVKPPVMVENIALSRGNVCLNDTVSVSLNGNVPDDAELNWNFGDATIVSGIGAGPYVLRWDEEGTKNIILAVKSSSGKQTFSQSINIQPAPKAEFNMHADACPAEKIIAEISRDKNRAETHTWDFDGADILSGDDGGPYEVKWEQPGKKVVSLIVKGENGCISLPYRQIINVHSDCCNVSLANAFTPNGDGKNDVFHVVSVGPHTILRFVVYNRYGMEMFSTNNESQGWDGTYGGVPQEIGTYTYKLRYRCGETLYEKDGEVMLLR